MPLQYCLYACTFFRWAQLFEIARAQMHMYHAKWSIISNEMINMWKRGAWLFMPGTATVTILLGLKASFLLLDPLRRHQIPFVRRCSIIGRSFLLRPCGIFLQKNKNFQTAFCVAYNTFGLFLLYDRQTNPLLEAATNVILVLFSAYLFLWSGYFGREVCSPSLHFHYL